LNLVNFRIKFMQALVAFSILSQAVTVDRFFDMEKCLLL